MNHLRDMKPSRLALIGLGCWILLGDLPVAIASESFQAGFATTDTTPPVGWRCVGNYSELVSTGVHDPLFAKAMVLSQGETRMVK